MYITKCTQLVFICVPGNILMVYFSACFCMLDTFFCCHTDCQHCLPPTGLLGTIMTTMCIYTSCLAASARSSEKHADAQRWRSRQGSGLINSQSGRSSTEASHSAAHTREKCVCGTPQAGAAWFHSRTPQATHTRIQTYTHTQWWIIHLLIYIPELHATL